MRLINVETYAMAERDYRSTRYAILSHTWEEDEVMYEDMENLDSAHQKKGFRKIELCCRQAAEDELEWAWVDTCCIDKRSSAELSEAINSMYKWYGSSFVCYAYLADVHAPEEIKRTSQPSRWFSRGWTLQELIAPFKIQFFTQDWIPIGTREMLGDIVRREKRRVWLIVSLASSMSTCLFSTVRGRKPL